MWLLRCFKIFYQREKQHIWKLNVNKYKQIQNRSFFMYVWGIQGEFVYELMTIKLNELTHGIQRKSIWFKCHINKATPYFQQPGAEWNSNKTCVCSFSGLLRKMPINHQYGSMDDKFIDNCFLFTGGSDFHPLIKFLCCVCAAAAAVSYTVSVNIYGLVECKGLLNGHGFTLKPSL